MLKNIKLLLLPVLFSAFINPSHSKEEIDLENYYVENPPHKKLEPSIIRKNTLVAVLAMGEVQNLNTLKSFNALKQNNLILTARLYSILGTANRGCIPESHFPCTRKYYLTVYSSELPHETAAFELGEVGEIKNIVWLKPDNIGQVHFKFSVFSYSQFSLEYNPQLKSKQKKYEYELWATTKNIKVIQLSK